MSFPTFNISQYQTMLMHYKRTASNPRLCSSPDDDLGVLLGGLRVPITETIASLLTDIFEHKADLKGSSVNHMLRIWPSHFQQFGSFMSDEDRDVLLIADPKVVQSRIDAQPREKALHASAGEKVSLGQLGIKQGAVSEANS